MKLDSIFSEADTFIASLANDGEEVTIAVDGQARRVTKLAAADSMSFKDIRVERDTLEYELSWYDGLEARIASVVSCLDGAKAFYEEQAAPAAELVMEQKSGIFSRWIGKASTQFNPGTGGQVSKSFEAQRAFAGRDERLARLGDLVDESFRRASFRISELEDIVFLLQEAAVRLSREKLKAEPDVAAENQGKILRLEELAAAFANQIEALEQRITDATRLSDIARGKGNAYQDEELLAIEMQEALGNSLSDVN